MATDAGDWSVSGPDRDEGGDAERDRVRRDFFASHGIFPPRRPQSEPVGRLAAEPKNDCVLLGPKGSGKTALLSAFGWAGAPLAADDPQPLPLGALTDLVKRAEMRRAGGAEWPATEETTTYSLQVRLGSSAVLLRTQDGPGGQLFPFSEEEWQALPGESRLAFRARALVLCVDAVEPQPDLWRASLPPLLASFAATTGRFTSRLSSSRPARTIDYPRLLVPERQLAYERILVAVSRVDPLVTAARELLAGAVASGRYRLRDTPSRTEIALHLDPVLVLDELVPGLLELLRPALAPETRLAVGLTSAWGLDDSARRWSPFGVEACVRFLIDGVSTRSVVPVGHRSTAGPVTGEWVELQLANESERPPGDQ